MPTIISRLVGVALCPLLFWCIAVHADELRWESHTDAGTEALTHGNYAEAEQQLMAALNIATGFAADDPRLAMSFANLARVYQTQGQYAQAEPLYRRLLALQEHALGPMHPRVADVLERYASLLRAMYPVRSIFPWSAAAKMTARAAHIRHPEAPDTADLADPWPTNEADLFSDQ